MVLPGTYTVRLTAAGKSYTQPLKVTLDPRSTTTPAELQKQFDFCITVWRDMMRAAEVAREGAGRRGDPEAARILGGGGRGRGGRGAANGVTIASVTAQLGTALSVAESADRTPPAAAYDLAARAQRDLAGLLAEWKKLTGR
jgi:hypothetical protein